MPRKSQQIALSQQKTSMGELWEDLGWIEQTMISVMAMALFLVSVVVIVVTLLAR
jgi:hypothetical protein